MVYKGISALFLLSVSHTALAQTAPSSHTSAIRYDAMGRVVGEISPDPDGAGQLHYLAIRNNYDAAGHLISTEKGELAGWQSEAVAPSAWSGFAVQTVTAFTYDARDRKTSEATSPGSASPNSGTIQAFTQYSYNDQGLVLCTATRMNPATFGSLSTDACSLTSDGGNGQDRIERNSYDAAGQLLKVQRGYGTSVQQDYATYEYTANGKQRAVIDANGNRAQLAYDGYDRQNSWIFPSPTSVGQVNPSDHEDYGWDENGNRTSLRKRDGRTLSYVYDALNRMSQKIAPTSASGAPGYVVNYGYDTAGRQTSALFSSGQGVTNTYDALGERIATTTTMDGVGRTIWSRFDADGERTQVSASTGYVINYGHDDMDRLTSLAEGGGLQVAQITYDATGSRNHLALAPNGTSSVMSWYDGVGRLQNHQFWYIHGDGNESWTLGYNPASQITSASGSNDAYAWNGAVNVDRSYSVNGLNQYSSAGPATFGYDANGNLTSDGSSSYVYDAENRLVSASGARTATMSYDPLGRLWRVNGAGETRFEYDGDRLLQEYDGSGSVTAMYAHGAGTDDPLIWYTPNGRRYFLADHQGSVAALADDGGYLQSINSYDEYGIPGSGNTGRFGFTGQVWLPELGMWYYKARVYSPTLGRFLQTDPVGYKDQVNLYSYVADDPVNKTDPSGNESGCVTLNTGCGISSSDNSITLSGAIEVASYLFGGLEVIAGGGPEDPIGDAAAAATIRGGRALSAEVRAAERGVGPGPYARESVPAGPGRRPSASQQSEINRMGGEHGCHTCGTRQPGTKSGNFIGDHQPPTKLNPPGGGQQYYPHCQGCSNIQGGRLSQMSRTEAPTPPPPPPAATQSWWRFW